MPHTITLRNVATGYGDKRTRHTVSDGINATLGAGMVTCLLGPNGAGKSTLLRSLAGFQPVVGGQIRIDDRDISTMKPAEIASLMAVVLTERPDVPNMDVRTLVGLGRSPYTGFWGRLGDDDRRIVEEALNMVGIGWLAERTLDTLSDGERQKALIAKALAQNTPVILLDEPTAFLDYPGKADLLMMMRRIAHAENKTVLLSTHDIELALQAADTLWLLDGNKGFVSGTPRQLSDEGTIGRYFASQALTYDNTNFRFTINL